MRKDFGKQSWMYPMPVLLIGTYDEEGRADVMNAAWGGIHDTNQIGICLSEGHKTTKNILRNRCFSVSFATEEEEVAADYVGLVSANDVPDKMAKTGWHEIRSEKINAPLFAELPVALECSLVSYDRESGYLVADIVNVSVETSVLSVSGKIDLRRFHPILFDPANAAYVSFGTPVGHAFSDGKTLK
ncbi:MAG: flavin reductase [Clostridia bacterium]|nr:flavin reductase [Clostridia bacterium]